MKANASFTKRDLPALTGLRFFAAIAIVLHHMRGTFGFPTDVLTQVPLGNGVSFFYVLSGFILTYVYHDAGGSTARGKFLLARFARVWPLHLVTFVLICLVISPVSQVGTEDGLLAAFLNLTLLHAWMPDYRYFFSFNSVSWSLSVEAFFYLIFPLVLLRPARWLMVSAVVVISMMTLATWLGVGPYTPGDSSPSITSMMYINPATRSFEFVLGVVTAVIWLRIGHRCAGAAPLLQAAAVALVIASWSAAPELASRVTNLAAREWLYHGGLTCVSSAFLIFSFAQQGALARVFSFKPLVYLGKISFALYLVHQIPIHAYNLGISPFDQLTWPVYILAVLAASAALHHAVENPARSLILDTSRRLSQRESRKPLQPTP